MAFTVYKGAAESSLPIALVPLWGEYPNVEGSVRLGIRDTTLLLIFMRSPAFEDGGSTQWTRVQGQLRGSVFTATGKGRVSELRVQRLGTSLPPKGKPRKPDIFDPDLIDTIPRTIEILENNNRQSRYVVSVELDLRAFGLVEEGREVNLRGNFNAAATGQGSYYLAANPIGTVKPDFHAPTSSFP